MALLGAPPPDHQHQLYTQHQAPARSAPRQARLNLPFCLGVSHSTHLLLPFRSELRLPLQRLHPHTRLGTHCAPTATSTSAVLSAAPSPATAASPGNLLEMQTPGPPTKESENPRGKSSTMLQHVPQGILMVKSEPRLCKTSLSHQASSSQLLWPGLAFSPPPPLSCDPWYLTPSCSLPLAHIAHSDADHTSLIANLFSVTEASHFSISYSTVLSLTLVQICMLAWP